MASEVQQRTFEHSSFPSWRAVGLAENLATDEDIARFLVALYQGHTEGREQRECYNFKCHQCNSLLMMLCTSCNTVHVPSLVLNPGPPAAQTLQLHPMDGDTLAQGPAQEEGLLLPQDVFQQLLSLDEPLQQVERLLVHGGLPPEEGKPFVEGEAPQQGPHPQAAFVEEQDPLLPGAQESKPFQEDSPSEQGHLLSLQHTPQAVFVPENPLLPHSGFLKEDPAEQPGVSSLQRARAALVSMGGTEAVAEDPQFQPAPSFQMVPQAGSLPQTPTLVHQAVHLAVPQQQDSPVQQQAAALAEQVSACAPYHPQSLETFLELEEKKSLRKQGVGQDVHVSSQHEGHGANDGRAEFENGRDLVNTLQVGSLKNDPGQGDVNVSCISNVMMPLENEQPETILHHPASCKTENTADQVADSFEACSTEVKRSRFGRVLIPKTDPSFVCGTEKKNVCATNGQGSRGKQSPKKQLIKLASALKHEPDNEKPVQSFPSFRGQYQFDKRLEVSLVRCDALIKKNGGNAVGERRAVIKRQEHIHTERVGYHMAYEKGSDVKWYASSAVSLADVNDQKSSEGNTDTDFPLEQHCAEAGTREKLDEASVSTEDQLTDTLVMSEEEVESPELSHTDDSEQGKDKSGGKGLGQDSKAGPFVCTDCGKSYQQKASLSAHRRCHANQGQFVVCDLCGLGFILERSLRRHKAKKHPGNGALQCKLCSFHCSANKDMKTHMKKSHWRLSTQQCEFCGVRMNPQALKAHILRHKNEKPLSCDQCDRSFRTNSQLNNHRRSRHGEMEHPFRCERCGRGFVKAQSLKHHMYSHTGERPFICTECPSAFARKDYLNKHMTKHTGEKRFQCDVCNKKFSFVSSLNSHKKRKHGANKQKVQSGEGATSSAAAATDTGVQEIPVQTLDLWEMTYLVPVYSTGSADGSIVYTSPALGL
ncbi:uncharacterized protein LOC143288529 [Babylonia areolata]|uniref:uncharacterized protein LOC143288529 n=1 Tax=Babylonia areolata TaxID=304850 RepID=UPI003FD34443